MANTVTPKIGEWYINANKDKFEVVAIDEDDSTVEIQHFDGTIEELELNPEQWFESEIMQIQPPEDWSGSYDIQREDYGVDLETSTQPIRRNPLDEFE